MSRVSGAWVSGLWLSAPPCKQQSLHVGGIPKNAGAFHRFGALGTWRLGAGFLQRRQRLGFEVELGAGIFDRSGHGSDASIGIRSCFREAKPARLPAEEGARARRRPNPPPASPGDRPPRLWFRRGRIL